MKVFITTLTLLLAGMFLTAPVLADDAGDVKAAFLAMFVAINAGDAGTMAAHHTPEYSTFNRGGGLLVVDTSLEEQRSSRQALFDAIKINLQPRNVEVKVYGNAAVVTAYLVGSSNPPNSDPQRWTDRRTGVWTKQGGTWKEVHMHQSPIRLPQ